MCELPARIARECKRLTRDTGLTKQSRDRGLHSRCRLQGSNPADAMTNVAARTMPLLFYSLVRETFGASRGWEHVAWQTLKCRHAPTLTRPSQYEGFQQE